MTEPTREQALLEEFKTGLSPENATALQLAFEAAGAELGTYKAIVIELEDGMASLGYPANGGPEDQTVAGKALLVIAGLLQDRKDLREQVDLLSSDANAANARAEKAEAGEKKAKASLTKGTTPAKPRKLGAVDAIEGDEKATAIEKLRARIDDADEVQVAFSDGTREVHGLAPVNVAGDAWRDHAFGLLLKEPVEIEGPTDGGTSVTIDGYALILDGKQVAYSRRSTPLQVAPGQKLSLSDDIIF